MKLTLILLLFLWDNVEFTLTHEECAELPTVNRAFVLDEYKKTQYQEGDVIYFCCDPGYTTGLNTTYVCTEHGWRAATIGQCIEDTFPVRLGCTRPPALRNGYVLRNTTHVYTDGQKARYQCDHLYKLKGGLFMTCSNGQWIGDLQCLATFCEKPLINNGTLQEEKEKYEHNEVLSYSCRPGYTKVSSEPSVCLKADSAAAAAQWSPRPQCEAITCKLSSDPPAGTTYSPQNQIIFRPGQTVTVSCGEKQWVKSNELQSAGLTCLDTGRWDYDPVCQMVTCTRNAENVYIWQRSYYGLQTVYIDQTLWYRCYEGYVETSPTGRAKCVRGGWEPNPLCKERGCPKPLYRSAEITDYYEKDRYNDNERVNFRCTYDPTVTFYVDCNLGQWRGTTRQCRDKPCTTPTIEHGEMLDDRKVEYEHGERVQFRCIGETYAFRVTCQQGKWNTPKLCKDVACRNPPRIANGEIVGQPKLRYQHGETVDFRCTTGSEQTFRVSCQSGEWIPEDQCPDTSPVP